MIDLDAIDWEKVQGLIPAVVQSVDNRRVLMLGYMNREALQKTLQTGRVTFWSRTRSVLWTKGETSGHHLELEHIALDCDQDTLLVQARPRGPVCHLGTPTCFAEGAGDSSLSLSFLTALETVIEARRKQPIEGSYTASLFEAGREKILQKLGEEAVEVLVSSLQTRERTIEETADLIYHLLVFLADRRIGLEEVVAHLESRHRGGSGSA